MPEAQEVPRFASFRPKPIAASAIDGSKAIKQRSEQEQDRRAGDAHKHKRSKRDTESQKKLESSAKRGPPTRDETPEPFIIDKRGDEHNLRYGSIHRYDISHFRRYGSGSVLGAAPGVKIDRDFVDEKSLVLTPHAGRTSLPRHKYAFSKVEKEKPRLLKIRRTGIGKSSSPSENDYISVLRKNEMRKRTGQMTDSESENDESHYRSIHGKAERGDQPSDEELQYTAHSDDSGSENGTKLKVDNAAREKFILLERQIEQSPTDVNAWVALIEHQDTLIQIGDSKRQLTNSEITSTAEIKIFMYEKALAKISALNDRETLLIGLMKEGSKVWETKAQSDRWERISRDNIDSLLLWKSYLDFQQTTMSTFQYEDIRKVYCNRIKLLRRNISIASFDRVQSLSQQLLYVLLRFTVFARESGYSELAIAIWQGVLEFNMYAPVQLHPGINKIELFKEFWESGLPRIGEERALGWRQYVENSANHQAPKITVDEPGPNVTTKDIFESWSKTERFRVFNSRMPARMMDEVLEDDPFRVILFSDLEDFIFPLDDMENLIIDSFLLFCRLPPVSNSAEVITNHWSKDSYVRSERLEYDRSYLNETATSLSRNDEILTNTGVTGILDSPSRSFLGSPETLFSSKWFRSMLPWHEVYKGDNGPLIYSTTRTSLKQLASISHGTDLLVYYLGFEWINSSASIKKVAKAMLKQHPQYIQLYNAYAMIEWSRGNKDVSEGVFTAALSMKVTETEEFSRDCILLWKSWAWACLEDGNHEAALHLLLSIPDRKPDKSIVLSPTILLRARQHLSEHRDSFLSQGHVHHAYIYAECLGLLSYLASSSSKEPRSGSQGDISAFINISKSFSDTLTSRSLQYSSVHQQHLQSLARLIFHHVKIGPFRPAYLREHLTECIRLFPENTIFFTLYTYNESRLKLDNRVRGILASTILTLSHDTISSRLSAIYYEISNGTIHSVRAAFEHALGASAALTKSSPEIWRFYILWAAQIPQFRRDVEGLWQRAIRACPWCKEIYMVGFEHLRDIVGERTLKDVWNFMLEKELRVHFSLEEIFDEM